MAWANYNQSTPRIQCLSYPSWYYLASYVRFPKWSRTWKVSDWKAGNPNSPTRSWDGSITQWQGDRCDTTRGFLFVIAFRLAVPSAQPLMKGIPRVKHLERETDLSSQINFQVNACKYTSAPLRLHGVVSTYPVCLHTNRYEVYKLVQFITWCVTRVGIKLLCGIGAFGLWYSQSSVLFTLFLSDLWVVMFRGKCCFHLQCWIEPSLESVSVYYLVDRFPSSLICTSNGWLLTFGLAREMPCDMFVFLNPESSFDDFLFCADVGDTLCWYINTCVIGLFRWSESGFWCGSLGVSLCCLNQLVQLQPRTHWQSSSKTLFA